MRRGFAVAFITALPLTLLLFCATVALSQTSPAVRRVEIKSILSQIGGPRKSQNKTGQAGLTDVNTTSLIFERKDGSYFLQGADKSDDKVVDASLIAALANAISAPANPAPTAPDLGITPEWLKANAPSVAQKFSNTHVSSTTIGGHPVHPDLFESAFTAPATIDKAIQTLFHSHSYCADCVHYFRYISVIVTFDDGTMLRARSHSEHPYMLPWNVNRLADPNAGTVAYNTDISRAILALLPEGSENRSQLAGENIAKALANIVLRDEEHETHLREVESKTGGTLSAIRARYTIDFANLGDRRSFGLLSAADGAQDLVMRLTAPDWPATFRDDVTLAYVDGKVIGADKFLSDGPQFEKLVLSVPWLNEYAQNHPKIPISLSFVHGASLSDGAFEEFSAEMRAIAQEKLIPRVEAAKDRVALLTIGQGISGRSEWLVFPDGHMLLWHLSRIPGIRSPSDLPAWDASQYSAKPCGTGKNRFTQCVGREVSPEGNLLPAELEAAVNAQ